MAISASDQANMNQMDQGLAGNGNIPWSNVLGFFPGDAVTPSAGTPTLAQEQASGMFEPNISATMGYPTLAAQESGGVFAGDMGPLSGNPTTAQEQLLGEATMPMTPGTAALGSAGQMYSQPVAMFARQNDIPMQWVKAYVDRHGTLPTSDAELNYFMLSVANNPALAKQYSIDPASTIALAQNYAQSTRKYSGINVNGIQLNPGTVVPQFLPTLQEQTLYGNAAGATPNPYTLAAQEQTGYIGGSGIGAAGGGQATIDEQKVLNQQNQFLADLISNAGKGFADPFSYAAKLQGLQQSGTLGRLLGNNLAFASGNSLGQLQQMPNLTNTQLATDLASAQNGGGVTPATAMFMQRMLGVPTAGGSASNGQAYAGGSPGGVPMGNGGQPLTPVGGDSSNPLNSANIGFSTSLQQFNRLNPTLQNDYADLVQNLPNGQTNPDFLAALKQGDPGLARAGMARLGQVEGL